MSERREWKVGLFVVLGLVLVGGLLIYFSKGLQWKPTYTITLVTPNVGGVRPQASVLLSGVRVGQVVSGELAPDGKSVRVELEIYEKYKIHGDAVFAIDSLGLLGDQFISVTPKENKAQHLKDGDEVACLPPFDFQEVARAGLTFIQRVDVTAQKLNDAITRIDEMVLNEHTLSNLAVTFQNFRRVSENAEVTVSNIGLLFESNSVPIGMAVTNLANFSDELNTLALELNSVILTNRDDLRKSIHNIEVSTATMRSLLADIENGKGVVGGLLQDQKMREELNHALANTSDALSNFKAFGSNINSRGLWSVLWKPKNQNKDNNEADEERRRSFKFPGRN